MSCPLPYFSCLVAYNLVPVLSKKYKFSLKDDLCFTD